MADETTVVGDIDQDCAEVLAESAAMTHENLMAEIAANAEGASSIVRYAGARKFNREDPIEAAAAEVIMRKKV
jgi:hypothetical protein